jgi:DNA mismatch repair protein MutL
MSNLIKILPEQVASKIAAGEVIQRPESVVKELIENSIDAGTRHITLIIKDSGKSLIQVIDDGFGMTSDDAGICFYRHSTSKINNEKDLDSIHTLGFRGEALYSVTAIAQVEVRTKTKEEELGTILNIENGKIINKTSDRFKTGTSISVKNLFYNTPARRNFLKSDATELKHIFDTFFRFCLCYPEIKFTLFNNDSKIYEYDSEGYDSRISRVFEDKHMGDLIYFSEDIDFLKIKGYINKPQFLKKNRGEQYIFLNRRYITNKAINHAVFSAYENFAKVQGYPFYLIFLNIDPAKVDVNVHPSKLEVKFYDEKSIYSFVNSVIKKALGSSDLIVDFVFNKESSIQEVSNSESSIKDTETLKSRYQQGFTDTSFKRNLNFSKERKSIFSLNDYASLFRSSEKDEILSSGSVIEQSIFQEFEHREEPEIIKSDKGIWQIQLKYIVTQIKSGIIFIDQHVAHERILYEKALNSFNNKLPFSQQLLFPKTIELKPDDMQLLKELLDDLKSLGFVIKLFSKNTLVLEGIPADVKFGNEENILKEILDDFKINKEPEIEKKDNLAKTFACKAAIKVGDFLTHNEMISLIDQLFATSMPYVCPHGRPILIRITVEELDKRFGRK